MTDKVQEELERVIQKAAIDGTLSERAVKQFTETLEANSALKAQVSADARQLTELKKEREALAIKSNALGEELKAYQAREKELQDRESQAEVLSMSLKYEQKRVEDHKNMVSLVFRNSLLKKQVMTPGHAGHVDQYGNQQGQEWPTKHDLEEKEE